MPPLGLGEVRRKGNAKILLTYKPPRFTFLLRIRAPVTLLVIRSSGKVN